MKIRTSKQRNAIPFTKAGDFPYREMKIRILHYTKGEVWIGTSDGHILKIGRPHREAWKNLTRGDVKTLRIERALKTNMKDKVENYYAYIHSIEENNAIVSQGTQFNNMPRQ